MYRVVVDGGKYTWQAAGLIRNRKNTFATPICSDQSVIMHPTGIVTYKPKLQVAIFQGLCFTAFLMLLFSLFTRSFEVQGMVIFMLAGIVLSALSDLMGPGIYKIVVDYNTRHVKFYWHFLAIKRVFQSSHGYSANFYSRGTSTGRTVLQIKEAGKVKLEINIDGTGWFQGDMTEVKNAINEFSDIPPEIPEPDMYEFLNQGNFFLKKK